MLQRHLLGTFHRLTGSLVTGDSIIMGYKRRNLKRLSHSKHPNPVWNTWLYRGYYYMGWGILQKQLLANSLCLNYGILLLLKFHTQSEFWGNLGCASVCRSHRWVILEVPLCLSCYKIWLPVAALLITHF